MMNQAEKAELLEQLEQWNKKDEYSRCIRAIEAIPEQERGYLLTVKLSRAYSNLAVLGDHGEHGTTVKWTGISSDTPLSCWSPSAPRVRTIPTGTPGWLFLPDGIPFRRLRL